MEEDPVDRFGRSIGVDPQAVAFLRDCPSDVQSTVIDNFDGSGSKDGNVLGRLQGYARHLLRRAGHPTPQSLGLAAKDRPEYAMGAVTTILAPGAGGTMGISQVGGGCAALPDFARRIGLTGAAEQFLARLPQEVLASVISGFDPSGTKDGNVWGRLLGYARSHWARHLHVDQETLSYIRSLPEDMQMSVMMEFDARGSKDGNTGARLVRFIDHLQRTGAPPGASPVPVAATAMPAMQAAMPALPAATMPGMAYPQAYPGALPVGVPGAAYQAAAYQAQVGAYQAGMMQQVGYAQAGYAPFGYDHQAAAAQQIANMALLQQLQAQPVMAPAPVQQAPTPAAAVSDNSDAILEFGQRIRLDSQALAFIQSLEKEVSNVVISKFDPSGTKDGNVWGRLLGYVRHVWAKHRGVDPNSMRGMPEADQMRAMADPNTAATQEQAVHQMHQGVAPAAYGGSPSLQQFSAQWGLNSNAEAFLNALPESVRDAIIVGFNGTGTKDGNVWGRLLGFARVQWMKWLGLDANMTMQLKGLPEEAQMLCMSTFDPSSSKDGNLGGRLQAFMNKCLGQVGYPAMGHAEPVSGSGGREYGGSSIGSSPLSHEAADPAQNVDSLSHDPVVIGWLDRCGLEMGALDYLQHLPEDLLQQVMDNFDPRGTKDGNVLGRLQGYVKFLARKRGLPVDAEGIPTKRMRH